MPALDEAAAAWRVRPGPEQTVALCAALGGPGSESLAAEVSERALVEHAGDVGVLLAVGWLQARLGWLAQAQSTLALAGKLGGRDPRPFEALGQVLLLRGDARRSNQALQRAIELGCASATVSRWLAAAADLGELQRGEGPRAVQAALAARGLRWEEPSVAYAASVRVIVRDDPAAAAEGRAATDERVGTVAAAPGPARGFASRTDDVTATRSAPAPVWVAAPPAPRSGARGLLAATLASAVVIASGHLVAARVQARRTAAARVAAAVVQGEIRAQCGPGAGPEVPQLRRLFELDGHHPEVIAAFLEDRVVGSLWQEEAPLGLSEAVTRARSAGLAAARVVAGRVAERLAAGDVVGARALVADHDRSCLDDPLYALVSAVALERAGDARALARYRFATERMPDSVPGRVLHARLSLLEGELTTGRRAVARLAAERGDEPVSRVLSRLAWALDPGRGGAPSSPRLTADERAGLPRPLRSAPDLVEAVLAMDRGDRARAADLIADGLALAEDPAEVTALGMIAVRAGQEPLALRAARRVHLVAPEYPGLPGLAARVALLRGRFADATLAVTTGAPAREVALVLAVDAYERLDPGGLRVALAARPGEAAGDQEAAALAAAPAALDGSRPPEPEAIHDLGMSSALWGEILGLDLALDAGRIDLARSLVRAWSGSAAGRPPRAIRLARLARVTGRPGEAVEHATRAVVAGDATPRVVVELVRALVEVGDAPAARARFDAHSVDIGPALGEWLDVLVTRVERGVPAGTVRAARCALPPRDAPLVVRALAVRALAEAGDLRAGAAAAELSRQHPDHPDAVAARALLVKD